MSPLCSARAPSSPVSRSPAPPRPQPNAIRYVPSRPGYIPCCWRRAASRARSRSSCPGATRAPGPRRSSSTCTLRASARVELAITRLDEAAENAGFLVALPLAIRPYAHGGTTWNVPHDPEWPDDVDFVATVIDALEASLCIDAARIYATGYSGGARLASALACRLPGRIAAISAVAGLRGPEPDCPPAADPVPVLAFHGLADPVNPYDGDPDASPAYWTHGIPEAVDRWRGWLGCSGSVETGDGEGVTRLDVSACDGRPALRLYTLEAAGHTWPGSPFAFPDYTGAPDASLDATALTLEWFALHPVRRSAARLARTFIEASAWGRLGRGCARGRHRKRPSPRAGSTASCATRSASAGCSHRG
jgi:polyhydroxybutyrate depolymerase